MNHPNDHDPVSEQVTYLFWVLVVMLAVFQLTVGVR